MVTIDDVARHAQVSVKTVSRVLNRHPHISAKTRMRVEASIRQLKYSPLGLARQLRFADKISIGILFADPSGGYQSQLNHALLRACAKAGRSLAVELFDEAAPDWPGQVAQFLDRSKVVNLVLVPPICDSPEIHALLRERKVRFVLISPSHPVAGSSAVAMDDRKAARELTQHLIDLGHTRIAHMLGRDAHVVTVLRRLGYQDALQAAGLTEACEGLVVPGNFCFQQALECAEALLQRPDPPTAIFAANDEMAIAAIAAAQKSGFSAPGDLSVVGFDDTFIGKAIWPPLTTVAQPFDGYCETIISLFSDDHPAPDAAAHTYVLPHRIVVRGSTGKPPASGLRSDNKLSR